MNGAQTDSIEQINHDIFQKIRSLEKQKAFNSVYILVDSFLIIADTFAINPSEYEYYREKYNASKKSTHDLDKMAIIEYLMNIIDRLENITNKSFDPQKLYPEKVSEASSEEEEAELRAQLKEFPELEEILDETIESKENQGQSQIEKNKGKGMHKPVFNLAHFYFKEKPSEIDYLDELEKEKA